MRTETLPTSIKKNVPFRETVVGTFIREAFGPVRSASVFGAYHLTRGGLGKIFPELHDYWEKTVPRAIEPVPVYRATQFLDGVDADLRSQDCMTTNFILGDGKYQQWMAIRKELQEEADHSGAPWLMSDYVVSLATLDGKQRRHFAIAIAPGKVMALDLSEHAKKTARRREFQKPTHEAPLEVCNGKDLFPGHEYVITEHAIGDMVKHIVKKGEMVRIRRMSPIANDHAIATHDAFGRDGSVVSGMVNRGVWSIGETQNLLLLTFGQYLRYEEGDAVYDQRAKPHLLKAMHLSDPFVTEAKSQEALQTYARERMYEKAIMRFFDYNPELVHALLRSDLYARFSYEFRDRHLSAFGSSEHLVAQRMLTGIYLYFFEGARTISASPSLAVMSAVPGYLEALTAFIDKHKALGLPDLRVPAGNQRAALSALFERFLFLKADPVLLGKNCDPADFQPYIQEAAHSLILAEYQIRRNAFHRKVIDALSPPLVADERRRQGLLTVAIGNIGIARVPNFNEFTMMSWLPFTAGYLPDGHALPPFDEERSDLSIEDAIHYVFNGSTQVGISEYRAQEQRMYEVAPTVLKFLQTDERVPWEVRDFMQSLSSNELAFNVLSRFGVIADQDPNVVSRFFKQGLSHFQVSSMYRYVFDFLRGVETHLLFEKYQGLKRARRLGRMFDGTWRNHDLSLMNPTSAIEKTLTDGVHRIHMLNQRPDEKRSTLKDIQEYVETVFGWDTHEMQYLRHQRHSTIVNSLGAAWDCICYSRKTLFNPRVLQQW